MEKPQTPNLHQIPPFSGLPLQGRVYLLHHLRWEETARGERIIALGQRADFMAIVGRGQVELSSASGETQTLQPGDCFGEGMLRHGVPSSFHASAVTDAGLWLVDRSDWLWANGMQTESEATTSLTSNDPPIPLWLKVGFVILLLALLILGPLLPEIASTELKDLARQTGRPDLVAEALRWATLTNPDSAHLQAALGYSLYLQGENSGAVIAFNKAITLDEESAAAHNDLGVALTNPSQAPQAIEHLSIAIELDPSRADYYFNLGNAYLINGDPASAAEAYQHAVDLDPAQVEARALWAGIALDDGDLEEAEAAWEAVLEIKADHAAANQGLGVILVLEGNYVQALPYLKTALELDPKDGSTRYYLGLALEALDRPLEAETEFEKAMLFSNDPAVIDLASSQLQAIRP